jgi:alpha-mannosidase
MKDMIESNWDQPTGKRALFTANQVINKFRLDDISRSLTDCLEITRDFLRPDHQSAAAFQVMAVGNCHIDTAWLWRYSETRRKTARSWSSQLAIIRHQQPAYRFAASQMQQFAWLKEDYPELFKRIVEAAKEGSFIPIGGSWVEMDGNLPSGESFARQFLYGQKFQMDHFGKYSDIFWLPGTLPSPLICHSFLALLLLRYVRIQCPIAATNELGRNELFCDAEIELEQHQSLSSFLLLVDRYRRNSRANAFSPIQYLRK